MKGVWGVVLVLAAAGPAAGSHGRRDEIQAPVTAPDALSLWLGREG